MVILNTPKKTKSRGYLSLLFWKGRPTLPLFLFLLVFCSCTSNKYAEFYVENTKVDGQYSFSENAPVIIEIEDTDEIYDWEQEGYCVIGSSIFYWTWVPRTKAVDCAKKYGASHILVIFKQGAAKQNSVTYNVPTSKTTYHYGTVYGMYGNVNYSGTSTTYGSIPVTINYTDQYYYQGAFFLAPRSHIHTYGVYLAAPENTPNKKDNSVRVAVVLKGSAAEKKGIRRGDRVTKINGITVISPEQIQEFIAGTKEIESIEVEHE